MGDINFLADMSMQVGAALGKCLLSPVYGVIILLIALHYRKQMLVERKLFAVKMHSWGKRTWQTIMGGFIAGMFVSCIARMLEISLSQTVIWVLWVIMLLLSLIRIRFLCLVYAASLLVLLQFLFYNISIPPLKGLTAQVVLAIKTMNAADLLLLVALLHVAEAILVRKQGASIAGPLTMQSKRGRIMGAYQMHSLWAVPLFVLIPASTDSIVITGSGYSWTLGAFPLVLGVTELIKTKLPQQKVALTSARLLQYAILLFVLAWLGKRWESFIPFAAIIAVILHEGFIWFSRKEESEQQPMFMEVANGLKILAVSPNSPAEQLGILPGEVIVKVNGVSVTTQVELHRTLRLNPAFCKLEVNNIDGEVRFLQRAMYANEHYQLGVLPVPDNQVQAVADIRPLSLFSLFQTPCAIRRTDCSMQVQAKE